MKHLLFVVSMSAMADMINPINIRPVTVGSTTDAPSACANMGTADCELHTLLSALIGAAAQHPAGMWSLSSEPMTLRFWEETAGAGVHTLGLWSDANTKMPLFQPTDTDGASLTLTVADLMAGGIDPFSFGFYLDTPPNTWYSIDQLNAGGIARALAFEHNGVWAVGFDDYAGAGSDLDFQDALVVVRGIQPVPEPTTIMLLGTGLVIGYVLRRWLW